MARPRKPVRKPAKKQPKRILNCIPSPERAEDWRIDTAEDAGIVAAAPQIPPRKDLRAAWWKVNDQGSTGSCVGWASADAVLRWHFVKTNRIGQNELISPRFQWMAAKETDEFVSEPTTFIESAGTSLKAALDIARRYGSVEDRFLPFATGALYPGEEQTLYAIAAQRRIASYFNASLGMGHGLAEWRSWIANHGPLLVRLDVDATWDNATATEGKLDDYRSDTVRGGHAVALVGYTVDRFIVRNSWGTSWGKDGFAFASEGYASAAFTEAYGITV